MDVPAKPLADNEARRTAIAAHDKSFLVEAGAGSGKTAVLAGRIAMMLANGVTPKSVAAVTFTELAASELFMRVRDFAAELADGTIPAELRIAFPQGLSEAHRNNLASAMAAIDEITCSTIHGFCQRLIKPYPVEADIDPGAGIMDKDQAELAFLDITDTWLREQLSGDDESGLLAEMVLQNPAETFNLIQDILKHLRKRRAFVVETPPEPAPLVAEFCNEAERFASFLRAAKFTEPETLEIASRFSETAGDLEYALGALGPAELVKLLLARPHGDLCTTGGAFLKYKKKGKWADAAKRKGFPTADGDRMSIAATQHHESCCAAWTNLLEAVAAHILAELLPLVQPVIERFTAYKRSVAILDFDDLIFAARNLLRDHPSVRQALALRYTHVLVDEFQDTDPLQTEIFWRLCGEPLSGTEEGAWDLYRIRPGALFLVGDPKQAIYRFRGADVKAYVQARSAFLALDPGSVLTISTNFRSCAPILDFVNQRFKTPLSVENGQPGFTALDAFHPAHGDGPCVAALDVKVADAEGKANAEQQRDGEADAVAELCARLIGSEMTLDRRTGERRPCRPGDIALLAPTGTDLWRYEETLERRGIPVATQAGKGLFRRQEIQDLIAITRVLADRRDRLALGALMRGPVVGLSEEELLDIVWSLARSETDPDSLPRFDLGTDAEAIPHTYARDIIEKLQALSRRSNATSPFDLLSQAVDVLRLRPILLERHQGQAQRALANVELYLSMSRAYAVRGLRAFAEAMTAAWSEESRAVEGRPDAQEEAVALFTMHAAKGLEWPIVIPINTMTQIKSGDRAVSERSTGRFHCPVFGVHPAGYEDARKAEKAEFERERVRLWYVAATRARELLVLPRLDTKVKSSAWNAVVELSLADLPALDMSHHPAGFAALEAAENTQSRDVFAAEADLIACHHRKVVWKAPSRDEGEAGAALVELEPQIMLSESEDEDSGEIASELVQGSRNRGLVLHKLIEEVLTGEVGETRPELEARALELMRALGQIPAYDATQGLSAAELAGCVLRTLALPEIAALRPNLLPEFPLYASAVTDAQEDAMVGIADAVAFDGNGAPKVIVDWKSDVAPSPETVSHYRAQVGAYLAMIGTQRGLIVLATSGTVIEVTRH